MSDKKYVSLDEVDYESGFTIHVNGKEYEVSTYEDESNDQGDMYIEIFVNGDKIETLQDFYNRHSIDENVDIVSSINQAVLESLNDYFAELELK